MKIVYQTNGNLPAGILKLTWGEFKAEFGFNSQRRTMIKGMEDAIKALKDCNCSKLYIDGSFASNISTPNDYDACYDPTGIDFGKLYSKYPVFFDFKNGRENQKKAYKGEFFSATAIAAPPKQLYIEFFQKDRNDDPKGIIELNLNEII